MQFALAQDGHRIIALPNTRAICSNCKTPVIAKCGELNVWHWAHENLCDCDSWAHEPITQWHLDWQANFPIESRERFIPNGSQSHRADIVAKNNIVIEVQNSPISTSEIFAREQFYGDMLWIINSQRFKHNLVFKNYLNDFDNEIMDRHIKQDPHREYSWIIDLSCLISSNLDGIIKALRECDFFQDENSVGEEYWRNSKPIFGREIPSGIKNSFKNYLLDTRLVETLNGHKNYSTNFQWKYLSRCWIDAQKTRLLDLNNGFLFFIRTLHENGYGNGEIISKWNFLRNYVV